MAGKAVKYHRNFTLEPMNAYERHVIHAALQDYPEVTTFSTGSEPHRRIVGGLRQGKIIRSVPAGRPGGDAWYIWGYVRAAGSYRLPLNDMHHR